MSILLLKFYRSKNICTLFYLENRCHNNYNQKCHRYVIALWIALIGIWRVLTFWNQVPALCNSLLTRITMLLTVTFGMLAACVIYFRDFFSCLYSSFIGSASCWIFQTKSYVLKLSAEIGSRPLRRTVGCPITLLHLWFWRTTYCIL